MRKCQRDFAASVNAITPHCLVVASPSFDSKWHNIADILVFRTIIRLTLNAQEA
jgi:hypothetical protein